MPHPKTRAVSRAELERMRARLAKLQAQVKELQIDIDSASCEDCRGNYHAREGLCFSFRHDAAKKARGDW